MVLEHAHAFTKNEELSALNYLHRDLTNTLSSFLEMLESLTTHCINFLLPILTIDRLLCYAYQIARHKIQIRENILAFCNNSRF